MKSTIRQNRSQGRAWITALMGMAVGGCSELSHPYLDDVPPASEVSTPSVEGVHKTGAVPVVSPRGFEPAFASAQDGSVSHWPLWWEDPFVDKGSEDDPYAWTWEDYVAFPYGLGRSLVNTMGWPVSVAVQPPWTVMGSDGVLSRQALGYDHDAAPLPGGLAPPIDVLEIGTPPPETHDRTEKTPATETAPANPSRD